MEDVFHAAVGAAASEEHVPVAAGPAASAVSAQHAAGPVAPTGPADQGIVHVAPIGKSLVESIKELKEQQAAMKAAKKDLTRQLKNACKRRNRLKKRARQLTDADLVEVLQMRRDTLPRAEDSEPTAAGNGSVPSQMARADPDAMQD
jgi:Spy/CpxP family protein refolding chaperone